MLKQLTNWNFKTLSLNISTQKDSLKSDLHSLELKQTQI